MVDNLEQDMEMGQRIVTLALVSFNKSQMFHLTCAGTLNRNIPHTFHQLIRQLTELKTIDFSEIFQSVDTKL